MTVCKVNDSVYIPGRGVRTWGQLLSSIEAGDLRERLVVTAVRFRGVDQPSFREPATLAADLASIAAVDVDTAPASDLVASAVQTICDGIEPLVAAARQAADAFRLHDLPRGHRDLADFVLTFRVLADLTAVLDQADASLRSTPPQTRDTAVFEQVEQSLESLVSFEMNEDWISVADVLEYEIAHLLPRWASAVGADGGNAATDGAVLWPGAA
jgi:hypothetical protein